MPRGRGGLFSTAGLPPVAERKKALGVPKSEELSGIFGEGTKARVLWEKLTEKEPGNWRSEVRGAVLVKECVNNLEAMVK